MFEKKYWENKLKDLDLNDLNELSKLITKFEKEVDKCPEFLDVLKEWKKKYSNAKYFYCGGAGKGAYECEGEWSIYNWYNINNSKYDILYDLKETYGPEDEEYENFGDMQLLEQFNSLKEFKNACLNSYLTYENEADRKQFENDINNAKHVPHYTLKDAEDLYNGETFYEFINIETGEKYCLYTSAY